MQKYPLFLMKSIKLLVVCIVICDRAAWLNAQIATDGSLGAPALDLSDRGPDYSITEAMGKLGRNGKNLFHSFREFNVNTSETATFTGSSLVDNIFSRVTGDNASNIDGLIKSDIQGANFFFINPNGIVFGPNSRLDISGAVSFSTADYLDLGEDGRFNATNPNDSILTSAPPEAFGFLDNSVAGITLHGAIDDGEPQLLTRPGQVLSIVGGNLDLNQAVIVVPGGRLNLISLASEGVAKLDPTDKDGAVDVSTFGEMGDITMTGFASEDFQSGKGNDIDLSGEGGGSVVIRGGSLTMSIATLLSQTFGDSDGGNIDIRLQDSLKVLRGSIIDSSSFAKGNGGNIFIIADSLEINRQDIPLTTGISSQTGDIFATFMDPPPQLERGGNGGDITLEVKSLSIIGGAAISVASIVGGGDSGNITISSNTVDIDGMVMRNDDIPLHLFLQEPLNTGISAQTLDPFNTSTGGTITINSELLTVANRARIISDSTGLGRAGNIIFEPKNSSVNNKVEIRNAIVSASSNSIGGGGNIIVKSQSTVLDGKGNLEDLVGIQAQAGGEGDGGSISLDTNQLLIKDSARISSRSTRLGSGNAGNIGISADSVIVAGRASIDSSSEEVGGGGDITIKVEDNFILNNSQVTTMSDEDGGNITVVGNAVIRFSNSMLTAEAFFN